MKAPSIYLIDDYLSEGKILPVYYLFGSDSFALDETVKVLEKATSKFISSDFDKEIITAEKKQKISDILDLAYAFPFGEGKKILIVKNFERVTDKKQLSDYVKNPAETTILILVHKNKISNLKSIPYKQLLERGFLFEAKELKGADLVKWLIKKAHSNKIKLSSENAYALIDIVGEDKSLLEMQLEKFINFLNDGEELTLETIKKLSAATKEYNIFNLQDALSAGEKSKALEIIYNLLEHGHEMTYIVAMLTKYITTIAHSLELKKKGVPPQNAAKSLGLSSFYYTKCSNARFFLNKKRLFKAGEALLNADLKIKTTSTDQKSIATALIAEMME